MLKRDYYCRQVKVRRRVIYVFPTYYVQQYYAEVKSRIVLYGKQLVDNICITLTIYLLIAFRVVKTLTSIIRLFLLQYSVVYICL